MFNFITLFAVDMELTADVYRAIGLSFVPEQHGEGPVHLAYEKDGFVLEIYQKPDSVGDAVMLGFTVSDVTDAKVEILETTAAKKADIAVVGGSERMIIADPEGRQIYLQEK